ncbi:MAG TPA: GNAT family N-acetyltransferase [Ktedonobacteraceae bacterium]|nr:GNAT family N-acetyltransferase [Ktedonobacteraceae bacterium]
MHIVSLHDKSEIERFLRQNALIHLYELGDLDDFFWQNTTWYALKEAEQIQSLLLLYSAIDPTVLLAISENPPALRDLLQSAMHLLPPRFYAHLSGDLSTFLAKHYRVDSHGLHYKMALADTSRLEVVDTSRVVSLSGADLDELQALYRVSYPDNSFDPRMLETGHFYGIRRDNALVSVAGVHVYSPHYKVGVVGNVTTHPAYRGKGLGTAVCAKLCQELLRTVKYIGLNVKSDNATAIASYKRLGFEVVGEYEEALLSILLS